MANVAEFYELAGVVHSDNCKVCNLTQKGVRVRSNRIKRVLNIVLFLLATLAIYGFMFRLAYIVGGVAEIIGYRSIN